MTNYELTSSCLLFERSNTAKKYFSIRNSQFVIRNSVYAPWHFLNFLPLPQGQGSFLPTFATSRFAGPAGPESPAL
jgi:hypothetical protein